MLSKQVSMQVKVTVIRLKNQNRPIREIAEHLGAAKSTTWYDFKKKEGRHL